MFALLALITVVGSSCSLYESTGRKVIETNENGILGSYGFSANQRLSYDCAAAHQPPEFLKEPLDAVQTPYEGDGFTALVNKHTTPVWLAMERSTSTGVFVSCKIRFLASHDHIADPDFNEATSLAHDEIVKLEGRL